LKAVFVTIIIRVVCGCWGQAARHAHVETEKMNIPCSVEAKATRHQKTVIHFLLETNIWTPGPGQNNRRVKNGFISILLWWR